MIALKLMRLPHGTNRNRTLRRMTEVDEEEVDLAEVERLFHRFWRQWRKQGRRSMAGMRERRDGACV